MVLPETPDRSVPSFVEEERRQRQRVDRLLARPGGVAPRLVFPEGEEAALPERAYQVLRDAIHARAGGRDVALVPEDRLLTSRQAAAVLAYPVPYPGLLPDEGRIPSRGVGVRDASPTPICPATVGSARRGSARASGGSSA